MVSRDILDYSNQFPSVRVRFLTRCRAPLGRTAASFWEKPLPITKIFSAFQPPSLSPFSPLLREIQPHFGYRPLTAAVAAAGRGNFVLDGVQRMRERPIQDLVDGLVALGVDAKCLLGTGCPPVEIYAQGLKPAKVDPFTVLLRLQAYSGPSKRWCQQARGVAG